MIDPSIISSMIVIYPLILAFAIWYYYRKTKRKKEMWFVLGFLFLIGAYVFLPDPSTIQALYINVGNYNAPLLYGTIAAVFLAVAIIYFRKHLEKE